MTASWIRCVETQVPVGGNPDTFKVAYESVVSVSRSILLIDLKFDTFHSIKEKMNVIVKLGSHELLGFSDFSVHVDLVMRTKTPENEGHQCKAIHFIIFNSSGIFPCVKISLLLDDLSRLIRE